MRQVDATYGRGRQQLVIVAPLLRPEDGRASTWRPTIYAIRDTPAQASLIIGQQTNARPQPASKALPQSFLVQPPAWAPDAFFSQPEESEMADTNAPKPSSSVKLVLLGEAAVGKVPSP